MHGGPPFLRSTKETEKTHVSKEKKINHRPNNKISLSTF